MNNKQTRKYELIIAVGSGGENFMTNLAELCAMDFATAFEMWEFDLARGGDATVNGFNLFHSVSELKTRQLFCESLPLQKLVYSSKQASNPTLIEFLANLILAGKLDTADECLSKLRTNTHIDFNDIMRTVVDTTFALSCQKNGTRVPVLNKKQKTLLIDYIDKIKGPNKALLTQRMKEI